MKKKLWAGLATLLLVLGVNGVSRAELISGDFSESVWFWNDMGITGLTWGEGAATLTVNFTDAGPDSLWGYGSQSYKIGKNTDLYNAGTSVDLGSIANATQFSYSQGSLCIFEGDTVFFKGTNGYYGALVFEQIERLAYNNSFNKLYSGTWYFQNDQTGDFSAVHATPIPGAVWLFGSGMAAITGLKRRKKKA